MDREAYTIGVTDVLRISVWKNPELSVEVPVRADGMISVPLIDDVQAEGLTPQELKEVITRELSEFVTAPDVTVLVRQMNSRFVSVLGEVRQPTRVPLDAGPAGAGGDRAGRGLHHLRRQERRPDRAPPSPTAARSSTASTTTPTSGGSPPEPTSCSRPATRSSSPTEDSMRIDNALVILSLLLSPLAAQATDLTFSLEGQTEYDSNALRVNGKEDDDVLFRIRPQVKLHEDRGQDLRYSLFYAVPFEFAVDNSEELNDIDHIAGGRATYHVNDRLEFFASDDFRYLRSALRNVTTEDVIAGDGTLLVNQERDRVTLNAADIGARYRFTPRLTGEASISHDLYDTQRPDRADNWLLDGTASLNYIVTPKHTVGLGLRYIHQNFDDRENIPGSTVETYNAFAQWTYRFSETLQFEMAAGPSVIESKQDDPVGSVSSVAIPSAPLAEGASLNGLVNPDGTPAVGTANPGSLLVSQLAICPTIVGTTTQVFAGNLCPIGTTPTTAGVYIDGFDGALLGVVNAPVSLVDPAARGEDDTSVNVFGRAVLRKDWSENFHSALRYERTQGGASGLGGAVVADSASLSNTWDFAERWQLAFRGDWVYRRSIVSNGVSQYVQAGDIGDPSFSGGVVPAGAIALVTIRGGDTNKIDTTRYGVAGRLTHRFTRNTSGWVQLTYNEQTSTSNTLGNPSDFNDFLAVAGVRYVFDPIKLW